MKRYLIFLFASVSLAHAADSDVIASLRAQAVAIFINEKSYANSARGEAERLITANFTSDEMERLITVNNDVATLEELRNALSAVQTENCSFIDWLFKHKNPITITDNQVKIDQHMIPLLAYQLIDAEFVPDIFLGHGVTWNSTLKLVAAQGEKIRKLPVRYFNRFAAFFPYLGNTSPKADSFTSLDGKQVNYYYFQD